MTTTSRWSTSRAKGGLAAVGVQTGATGVVVVKILRREASNAAEEENAVEEVSAAKAGNTEMVSAEGEASAVEVVSVAGEVNVAEAEVDVETGRVSRDTKRLTIRTSSPCP